MQWDVIGVKKPVPMYAQVAMDLALEIAEVYVKMDVKAVQVHVKAV